MSKTVKEILVFLIIVVVAVFLGSFLLSTNINFSNPIVFVYNQVFDYNLVNNTFFINVEGGFKLIEINNFCSGFFSIIVFLTLMFAPITKLTKSRRNKYLLFGIISLYILNFLRVFLILLLAPIMDIHLLHTIGWFLMGIAIYLLWFFAIRTSVRK
jgi:exosortase/archaeosortase family protein